MKILIVDDEIFVRIGIKTIFDWTNYGFEMVGEAEDGIEAKELFIKYEPDIVLLDICMPRMNGLDFIRETKNINPFCRFVILSCHDEFNYVREAMNLGVRDYIMKTTVKKDELLEIVCRIANEIESERSKQNESKIEKKEIFTNRFVLFNNFLNEVIDEIEDNEETFLKKMNELHLNLTTNNFHLILFAVDNYKGLRQELEPKHYELLLTGVNNIVQEISKKQENTYVFKRNEQETIVLISFEEFEEKNQISQRLRFLCQEIIRAAKDLLNRSISAGVSGSLDCFTQISKGYATAHKVLERRFFTGPGSVNLLNDPICDCRELIQMMKSAEEDLSREFKNLDFDESLNRISLLRQSMKSKSCDENIEIKNIAINIFYGLLMTISDEIKSEPNIPEIKFNPAEVINFDDFSAILDYLETAVRETMSIIDNNALYKNRNTINLVKEYINENITKDIALNTVADYVKLSPGHLSRYFKKVTGENFTDYIINCKINTAKNMIHRGKKIWEIAQQLGYTEVSSFSRTFKKAVGISPQQFRLTLERNRKKRD